MPEEISFKTKPEIALEQLRWACEAGLAARRGADGRRLWRRHRSAYEYHDAGIEPTSPASRPNTTVWPSGTAPLPPKRWSGRGRPPKLMRRDGKHQPISVKQLALELPQARLAHDQMAGRHGRVAVLALCSRARSDRAS